MTGATLGAAPVFTRASRTRGPPAEGLHGTFPPLPSCLPSIGWPLSRGSWHPPCHLQGKSEAAALRLHQGLQAQTPDMVCRLLADISPWTLASFSPGPTRSFLSGGVPGSPGPALPPRFTRLLRAATAPPAGRRAALQGGTTLPADLRLSREDV